MLDKLPFLWVNISAKYPAILRKGEIIKQSKNINIDRNKYTLASQINIKPKFGYRLLDSELTFIVMKL